MRRYDKELIKSLEKMFENLTQQIDLPPSIVLKNMSVSAIAQQNLFEYFKSYNNDIEKLIPAYPEEEDAYESLFRCSWSNKYISIRRSS